MPRPDTVVVCGYPFRVTWVDHAGAAILEQAQYIGHTDVTKQEIEVLAADQGPHQERDTVLHEVLHAVVKMTGHREMFKDDDEERLVYAVSTALLGVLRANPGLVEWLTEEL